MKLVKQGYKLGRFVSQRRSDRGFAMPLAIGFGLAILMVTAAMLVRSHGDRTTATLQQATGSSLNVTESGITRVQSFVNNHRPMATYSLSDWLQAPTRMPNLTPCSATNPNDIANFATLARNWQNVDASNPTKGQFRIIDYVYQPSVANRPHEAPGTGTLTIEGRLTNQSSISRLQVAIPVQPGDVIGVPFPGVWITGGDIGNNRVRGNVMTNDCATNVRNINTTGTDPNTGEPYQAQHTSLQLPALPPQPQPAVNTLPRNINSDLVLPRPQDEAVSRQLNSGQMVQVFEYVLSDLQVAQSTNLTITPGQRVTFYLNGDIRRGGNIRHDCSTAPSGVPCNPTDFQVFGYGPPGSSICLNGNNFADMFILAPNYAVGVAGSGGGQGGIRGSVWAGDWSNNSSCGSNTSNVTVQQTANWDMLGLIPTNLPPRFAPISNWQRQAVTP